ncbi:MAG: hypothetical protein AB8B99_02760 [Phormidesmis sp.]
MLVIRMKDQLLQPSTVCQGCLMANQSGLPRWQSGRLRCGRLIEQATHASDKSNLTEYECAMGFRLAQIAD